MTDSEATAGPLWGRMHQQPRHPAATLRRDDIPTSPGVYAWYRASAAIYIGKADSLQNRLWKNHLGRGRVMTGSAFRRNVAEELGIATTAAIKTREYQPTADEVVRVRSYIEECEVAWLTTETPAAAADLETRMKREWTPPLTRR